jgi:NAD(P)-dependent dehydrogenase (short-subunit alcohol dehydrogenase family)
VSARFDGEVAIVTGGAGGIGSATCRKLAAEGARVVVADIDPGGAQAVADEIGGTAIAFDLGEPAGVERLVAETVDGLGRLDVLVNNAAGDYDTWQRGVDADLDVLREAMETNLLGAWRTTQACLPLLRRSATARIVNVSSGAGALTDMGGGTPAYRVSKTALNALTRILAAELRGEGILVNSVCPGWVATDMGGPGGRPVEDGAASVMWAVRLDDDGPTGGFFRDGRRIDW